MNKCNFSWRTPFVEEEGIGFGLRWGRGSRLQHCVMPKNHTDDHRSITGVTAENKGVKYEPDSRRRSG